MITWNAFWLVPVLPTIGELTRRAMVSVSPLAEDGGLSR
ncbi:MAG: hypothetical protein BMS9Abin12_1643 [Acidimicrobiia bacterium]|nr:MAG: hypothetical protein BMS9Abin12_1643 [Acidimicrobiia bacterium]